MSYDYIKDGAEIYRRSFGTIRAEADLARFPDDVSRVVVRMIHASGQIDLADDVAWSPGVVQAARAALQAGAPILSDARMIANGVIRSRLPRGNEIVCYLGDPRLETMAREMGTTKTAAAVELWADRLDGAVIAIGNAPTALFALLEKMEQIDARPAAVLGIPVGFIGSAESKQALVDNPFGLEYLTVQGRRGGSAVTVAAINAIASTAE